MAVQIAHALGAKCDCRGVGRLPRAGRGLGADRFLDYGAGRFEDEAVDMDIVFDTVGGEMQARSWRMLKPSGILVSTLGIADPDAAAAHGARAVMVGAVPDGEQLGRIAEVIDAGQVRPNMGATLPLTDAQELNWTGKVKGKIVLTKV